MVSFDVSRTPEFGREAFYCPLCGAFANQLWGVAYCFQDGGNRRALNNGDLWSLALCAFCQNNSVWLGERLIYPLARLGEESSPDMPDDVRVLYDEAREVAVVSRRAGAAMARATLELLVKRIDPDAPPRSTLVQRLDRIIPLVDTPLGQMLTFARHVGNAIHATELPDEAIVMVLDDDQTDGMELIFAAVNGLVEAKITRPRVAAEMYLKIPESVRERVERMS